MNDRSPGDSNFSSNEPFLVWNSDHCVRSPFRSERLHYLSFARAPQLFESSHISGCQWKTSGQFRKRARCRRRRHTRDRPHRDISLTARRTVLGFIEIREFSWGNRFRKLVREVFYRQIIRGNISIRRKCANFAHLRNKCAIICEDAVSPPVHFENRK